MSDPKPEGDWTWRRLYVFAVTTALCWVAGSASLAEAVWAVVLIGVTYLVAPSATEIVKGLQAWRGAA